MVIWYKKVLVILGHIKRENSIQEFQPLPSARKSRKLGEFFSLLYLASSFKYKLEASFQILIFRFIDMENYWLYIAFVGMNVV